MSAPNFPHCTLGYCSCAACTIARNSGLLMWVGAAVENDGRLPLSVFAVCGLSLTSTRPADIRNAGVIRAPQEQSLPRQSKLPTVNAHPLHRNCPESASKSCIHSIGSMKMYSPAGRTETPSDTHVRERCAVRKNTATRYTPQPSVQKKYNLQFRLFFLIVCGLKQIKE